MALYSIPETIDLDRLGRLLQRFLRAPDGVVHGNGEFQPPTALEFTPELSGAEQTRLENLIALAACPFDWTLEDLAVFRAERATLAAFLAAQNPTGAQTVAALKALIRVVAAIVRQS